MNTAAPTSPAAYPPRYLAAVTRLLKVEGGHVNDPVDRGGETNFGISLRFLASEGAFDGDGDGKADFDLDMDGDIDGADIRLLTRDDAIALYYRCFWQRLEADGFPRPLGEMLFDQAVNGGLNAARKLLQRAINQCLLRHPSVIQQLQVDGKTGRKTREAIIAILAYPALGMPALMLAYREAVARRYQDIAMRNPSQKRFLKGWLARANQLGREV